MNTTKKGVIVLSLVLNSFWGCVNESRLGDISSHKDIGLDWQDVPIEAESYEVKHFEKSVGEIKSKTEVIGSGAEKKEIIKSEGTRKIEISSDSISVQDVFSILFVGSRYSYVVAKELPAVCVSVYGVFNDADVLELARGISLAAGARMNVVGYVCTVEKDSGGIGGLIVYAYTMKYVSPKKVVDNVNNIGTKSMKVVVSGNNIIAVGLSTEVSILRDMIRNIDTDMFGKYFMSFTFVQDAEKVVRKVRDAIGSIGVEIEGNTGILECSSSIVLIISRSEETVKIIENMCSLYAKNSDITREVYVIPVHYRKATEALNFLMGMNAERPVEKSDSKVFGLNSSKSQNISTSQNVSTGSTGSSSGLDNQKNLYESKNVVREVTGTQSLKQLIIRADDESNSLYIKGSAADYELVRTILSSYDVPARQVYVKVFLIDMRSQRELDFSLDYLLDAGNVAVKSSFASAVTSSISGVLKQGNVEGFIKALERQFDAKVMSKPVIYMRTSQQSEIKFVTSVPYISSKTSVSTVTGIIQNVEYRDVGILFRLVANVTDKRDILLDLYVENSDLKQNGGVEGNPLFVSDSIQTRFVMKDGGIGLLGGIRSRVNELAYRGVPFISNVPLLKYLMGGVNRKKENRDMVVCVCPRIIGGDNVSALSGRILREFENMRVNYDSQN